MIGFDILQRFSDDIQKRGIHLGIGFLNLFFCYLNIIRIKCCTVKFFRISEHGFVTSVFYFIQNLADTCFIRSITVGTSFEQIFEQIFSGCFI